MHIEKSFISIAELENLSNPYSDSECILKSGLDLYRNAIIRYPYGRDEDTAICIVVVDGVIAGRYILFRTKLKLGKHIIPVQTGGGILVNEKYRGIGIGSSLIQTILNNNFYFGALYTRAAYNIVRKTETMLEIPQYVKLRYHGLKKVLDIPIIIKQYFLKRRYTLKKLEIVPQWAGDMIAKDNHKYMEVHDTSWLQWALDNTATGVKDDCQSFYAIYDKNKKPVGFFMTKIRTIQQDGYSFKKANLVEWASSNHNDLDEVDINILSYSTLDSSVSKFWTISENLKTGNLFKKYSFKRKGWFAVSISSKDERYDDIGDVNQWRIRYGCANTALVE